MNKPVTDRFKADDLEAIAASGDWHLEKEKLHHRAAQEYSIDAGLGFDLESKARRAARKVGLVAYKCRTQHLGNLEGFQVVDPRGNVVAGQRFDLTAGDVIKFCRHFNGRSEK
jgi:hypothetical protein